MYWNEEIECLPSADLRQLENARLAWQAEYVYRLSPFYREQFDAAGVKPEQINCIESLELLPFTDKSVIAAAQLTDQRFGPHQCADDEHIVRVVGTGGTSGQPIRLGWTRADVSTYNEMGARALWAMGCRPTDFVINCFNYSLYAGGVMDHGVFETLGAAILPYGIGQSRRLLETLAQIPGDLCLYTTPSYAVRLAQLAEQLAINVPALNVKKGFFSGEAGLQVPGYRQRIEEAWGMQALDLYGVAELGCQSGECGRHNGMHFGGSTLVVVELIDAASGAVKSFDDGAEGELVFTAVQRQACPLLRYRSHDFVQIFTAPCACGRTSFRFRVIGRSDDMFVVKGLNVYPRSIQQVLLGCGGELSGEYFVVLPDAPPIDYPPDVYVEVQQQRHHDHYAAIAARVADDLSRRVGIRSRLHLVPVGCIASEHKTRRLYRLYDGATAPADVLTRVLYSTGSSH